jgi:hypothetical protein
MGTRTLALVALVALVFMCPVTVTGQDIARSFLCDKITGFMVAPPNWEPQPDSYANTHMIIQYKPGNTASQVTGFRNGAKFYHREGLGLPTRSGFAIVAIGKEHLEMYVVNAGTLKLLRIATRSGSQMRANSVELFRGSCRPAGRLGQ